MQRLANQAFQTRLLRLLITAFTLWCCSVIANATPTFTETKSHWRSSEAILLDRNGQTLYELRIDNKARRLSWMPLADISPALQQAVIQSEDRRFYHHSGVDWRAIAAAVWSNTGVGVKRGGSTITMQLAAMLDPALSARHGGRSFSQKWKQILAAREIENDWSKAEILEAYFNLVSFRGEGQGIAAAAKLLFDKVPSGLNTDESLILAALIPSPNAKPLRVAHRACVLGGAMGTACESLRRAALHALEQPPAVASNAMLASHLARQLLNAPGEKVVSTLDANVQAFAERALRAQLASLAGEKVRDGAVLVMDNATGDVLAYVGNSGSTSSAYYVDGVRALRQAGSTLKPFLYEIAIENRLLTAASILDDSPVNISTPAGLYIPQNYDHDFKGPVSMRTALASSLNVPAVRTLLLAGMESFYARLKALGYESLTESADFYGYSLALGSAEVSLLQQVNAYRALANAGQWTPPRIRMDARREDSRRIMDPAAAFIIADILADRAARSVTFGLDNVLATTYWSAAKTGTSKDMRDNWSIGFSGRYTVGVWVGNFDGESMHNVSGVTGAAPIWREVMDYLQRSAPTLELAQPAGLIAKRVSFIHGIEPTRNELFLAGTEMALMTTPSEKTRTTSHIAYPGNGAIIALDPDIPVGRQMVFFEAKPDTQGLRWRLNGQFFESGSYVKWPPKSGRHQLALLDGTGRLLDQVEFQVRGLLLDKQGENEGFSAH
ncbi:MAG: penicillin-binding protein 1C [Pseudomonadota bacterium]